MYQVDRGNEWFNAAYLNNFDGDWKDLTNTEDIIQVLIGMYFRYIKIGKNDLLNHSFIEYFKNNTLSDNIEKKLDIVFEELNNIKSNINISEEHINLNTLKYSEEMNESFIIIISTLKNRDNKVKNKPLKF